MLYLAAFAEALAPPRPGIRECFTILTTAANADMAPYHDRMPVLLRREEREGWLKGEELELYLQRIPFGVEAQRA